MFYKETNFTAEALIGEIPKDWESVDLGEVVEIHDSKRIPLSEMERKNRRGQYPYCGANGIIDYIDDYIFDGEFVLLAEDGGSYGKFENTAYIMRGKFWVNNHAHILKAIEGKTSNLFLKYALDFLDLNPYIVGSTRKKLNQEQMREIRVPFPLIEEQKAIVGVLGVVDLAVAKAGEVIAKTERLKKGLMQELLTRGIGHEEYKQTPIGKTPKEWDVVKLKDIVEIDRESRDPSREMPDKTFLYVDIDSVEGGTGKIRNPKRILGKEAPSRARRIIHENDVIMSTVRPYLKAFAIVPKEYDNQICSTGFAVLSCGDAVLPYFLLNVLFSSQTIAQCNRMMVGGQYPALNQSQVSEIEIPLPPLSEQQKIADIFSTMDKKLELERNEKERLERTKHGLMDLLLTGKIRIKVD
jgi:type I restriction enzyme S subunit